MPKNKYIFFIIPTIILLCFTFLSFTHIILQTTIIPLEETEILQEIIELYDGYIQLQLRRKHQESHNNSNNKSNNEIEKDDTSGDYFNLLKQRVNYPGHFMLTISELKGVYGGQTSDLMNNDARDLYLNIMEDLERRYRRYIVGRESLSVNNDNGNNNNNNEISEEKTNNNNNNNNNNNEHTIHDTFYYENSNGGHIGDMRIVNSNNTAILCMLARSYIRKYVRGRMYSSVEANILYLRDAWVYGGAHLIRAVWTDINIYSYYICNIFYNGISHFLSEGGNNNNNNNGEEMSSIQTWWEVLMSNKNRIKAENNKNNNKNNNNNNNNNNNEDYSTRIVGSTIPMCDTEHSIIHSRISRAGIAFASLISCLNTYDDDINSCPTLHFMMAIQNKTLAQIEGSCFRTNKVYTELSGSKRAGGLRNNK